VHLKADRLAGRQRELPRQQAVTSLALGIGRLRLAGMTGLTRLARLQIGDNLVMDTLDFRIFITLMAALAGPNRIGLHGLGRRHGMPAVTIHAGGDIGVIGRLQVPGVVLRGRCVALLAVRCNVCLVRVERQGRICLVGIEVTPAILMTVGAVDRLCSATAMNRRSQRLEVDGRRYYLAGGKSVLALRVDMTQLASGVGRQLWFSLGMGRRPQKKNRHTGDNSRNKEWYES
jgi:hypothetical protein